MPLFRGTGGSGDASTDAYASEVATSAQTATTKANEASASAAAAATSASNAASSEASVAADATTASNAASAAQTAQTAAETAKTASETAKTAAETAQTAAETAETNAETAKTNAETAETNAAASATTATTKASEASTSATNAASSASSASTSATNAATSATDAQTAQTAAEAAQTAAEAAQESIDGFFLGAQASNPTVDLNGNAVTAGDWYFNTTDSTTRIYDGSAWNTVNPDLIGDTSPQLGGNLDLNSNDITGTGNVNITGNLVLSGTVDGRDVATDGTKLDGIEASATADQTAAEIRTLVESATDSNVFTDADHTKLNSIEASADVTDTANVTAAGALMDSELTSEASVKALNQGVATTDSPTFDGLTIDSQDVVLATIQRDGGGDGFSFGGYAIKFNAENSQFGDNYFLGVNLGGGFNLSTDSSGLQPVFSATSSEFTFNKDVGINTSSPDAELHIYKNASSAEIKVQNNDGVSKFHKSQDDLIISNDDTGDILFNVTTSETEAMRITSSGITVTGTIAATSVTSGGDNVLTTSSTIDGGTY